MQRVNNNNNNINSRPRPVPSVVVVHRAEQTKKKKKKSNPHKTSKKSLEKGQKGASSGSSNSNMQKVFGFFAKGKKDSSTTLASTTTTTTTNPSDEQATKGPEHLPYQAPEKLYSTKLPNWVQPVHNCYTLPGECVVCLESFHIVASKTVQLRTCHHMFHKECIEESLKHERRCPVCRTRTGRLQGKCPSGNMVVSSVARPCPGFEPATTIKIQYTIPSGTQESYHPNPGRPFDGTARTAYLPDTLEGRQVLARLKYAWKHGLTFTIGTSLTTRRENSVVWSSIHHKTSIDGGPHSWPDPEYMTNCNAELSTFGIPDADSCLSEILRIPTEVSTKQILTDAIPYRAPAELWNCSTDKVVQKVTQKSLIRGECSVCLNHLQVPQEPRPAVRIKNCMHVFHKDCLQAHLKKDRRCPRCRVQVKEPQGKGPSGDMFIETITAPCPGFEPNTTTIQITYSIPKGVQKAYHENPGLAYEATTRRAYLPDNEIGRKLLVRLKYAWLHGLSFSIGTSQTTGRPNSVVWSTVIHKTSLDGGPFGFPDPGFVFNCNDSLDTVGVPDAESLMNCGSGNSVAGRKKQPDAKLNTNSLKKSGS